uniref:Uncharacterized protein n=1 Tax=Lactuca sativa TaxID=4236 RepID=A0A9R1UFN1_LACSA|nr:hypothetical protein LSAT_V11C900472980 [Lactuca sativa]
MSWSYKQQILGRHARYRLKVSQTLIWKLGNSKEFMFVLSKRGFRIYIERPNLTSYEEVMIYRSSDLAVYSLFYSIEIERFLAEAI